MCSISGYATYNQNLLSHVEENTKILIQMNKVMANRGPDNQGILLRENIAMSHTRLSIRDIAGGNQPMERFSNNNSFFISYNGEIYNTKQLKDELKSHNVETTTTSDTELILLSFMTFGPNFVTKLNGIFAFSIWDNYSQKLYLYRDPLGIKPLFYHHNHEFLAFASEPKGLFKHPSIKPKLNTDSLRELLSIGPARTPGNGIFENIKEVLPGHYLEYSKYGLKDYTYWTFKARPHTDTYNQTLEKTKNLVIDSVKKQMISDIPICTFLSGGLDSSIVTAIVYKELEKEKIPLNTYSFVFKDNEKYFISNNFQPELDQPYVEIMLKKYPTSHKTLCCDEVALFNNLYEAVNAKDFPGMTDVDASLLHFCKLVSKERKVTLTGECADEIFGGYPWFYRPDLLYADGFPWSFDIAPRCAFLKQNIQDKLDLKNYAYDKYVTSLHHAPLLDEEKKSKELTRRRQVSYLNQRWFMQTLLDRMDRCSMYNGLEARVPFADIRIVEYLYNVPWEMKFQNNVEKALLRDALKDYLPKELFKRKKSPYPKSYNPEYKALLIKQFNKILEDNTSPVKPLIDQEKAKAFITSLDTAGRPWFGQLMTGPALIAYYIQIDYWMRKYNLTLPL